MIRKLEYTDKNELIFLDQTYLPLKEKYIKTTNYKDVLQAILELKIRGAPLIGITAAYGVVLGLYHTDIKNKKNFQIRFYKLLDEFRNSRPTAKNLFYALDRLEKLYLVNEEKDTDEIEFLLLKEADDIYEEDIEMCKRIGINGAELIGEKMNILTHCNAGELATGGIGTALGIIYTAKAQGKKIFVYADETRPLLQGARLTTFELTENQVDCTLIIDSMAANLMREGAIDCVIVGADRIAANGDTVNKIGSYSLAVNCHHHKIPLYIAAPSSTIDFSLPNGDEIEIEERNPNEVREINGNLIVKNNIKVLNPAFDLIPNEFISAIITEYKVHFPIYDFYSIKHMFRSYTELQQNHNSNTA